MVLGFIAVMRNARLNEITAEVDGGAGAGLLRIYDGTRPATADTALSGNTLLATLTFSDPSFPAASAGAMVGNAIADDAAADATGTASFFRVVDSVASTVMDGDVGTAGSDLNLNAVGITVGIRVQVTQFDLTEGNP